MPTMPISIDPPTQHSTLSVVMATYNGAKHVREQLLSIVEQSCPPDEIVVSDDGSTDGTLEVVEDVASKVEIPFRIVRNEQRLGFSENFLRAAARATCELVALSDQDDLWCKDKLAVMKREMSMAGAVLGAHAIELMDAAGDRTGVVRGFPESRVVRSEQWNPWGNYYGFAMVFVRSLLEVADSSQRGPDVFEVGCKLSHDRWVYFLASLFGPVVEVPEVLALYRQHAGQLYGGPRPRARFSLERLRKHREMVELRSDAARARVSLAVKNQWAPEIVQRLQEIEVAYRTRRAITSGPVSARPAALVRVARSSSRCPDLGYDALNWRTALEDAVSGITGRSRV